MENTFKPRKGCGLTLGFLTGWVGVFIVDSCGNLFLKTDGGMNFVDFNFGFLLPAYIFIGLPIALTLGLILGHAIWALFEIKNLTQIRHAMLGGGIVGALLGGTNFYLTFSYTNILHNLADLASTIVIGILAGWVTHKVGYPKAAVRPFLTDVEA